MTDRPPTVPVLFACLLVAAGSPRAADPPKDPPAKQSVAELLVGGTWRLVKQGDKTVPPGGPGVAIEFTAGGKMISQPTGGAVLRPPQKGIYRVEGRTVEFSLEASGDEKARDATWEVESITEDTLVVVPAGKAEKVRTEYRRRTTAELLVGTWKMVKEGDMDLPADKVLVTMEFTKDRKLTIRAIRVGDPPERHDPPRPGTYKLEDKTLHLKTEASKGQKAREWSLTIESVTEDELVTVAGERKTRAEYKRVAEKTDRK